MKEVIGSAHRRIGWLTWLNILDVLTSFHAHHIAFPEGVSYDDLVAVTDLVSSLPTRIILSLAIVVSVCPRTLVLM